MFPVQLTTSRIGNLTRLILTLAICDDHTYIQDIHRIENGFYQYSKPSSYPARRRNKIQNQLKHRTRITAKSISTNDSVPENNDTTKLPSLVNQPAESSFSQFVSPLEGGVCRIARNIRIYQTRYAILQIPRPLPPYLQYGKVVLK